MAFLEPATERRRAMLAALCPRLVRLTLRRGAVWGLGRPLAAVALLTDGAPGTWDYVRAGFAGFALRAPRRLPRLLANDKVLSALHGAAVAGPHRYLVMLAVADGQRGRGLGSLLLTAVLDQTQWPTYLETANPRNVPLYERLGFRVTGTAPLDEATRVVGMLRQSPSAAANAGGSVRKTP